MPFEGLADRLLRAGIAPRHVRRYRRELEDHLADLTEAQREAGHGEEDATLRARALLGAEEELAAAMLARPELKSWAARVPWVVFGLAPPIVMIAAIFLFGLPLGLIARLGGWMGHEGMAAPEWFRVLAQTAALFFNLVLGPGLVFVLMRAAKRQRMSWKWPVLATSILAVAGFHMVARFPAQGQHGGQIAIGVLGELMGPPFPLVGPLWGVQFLLTVAPLLWLLRSRRAAELPD